ncbi:MAG: hypothetical protein U0L49_11290 [Eubacterium sp.]|nr:hypothetical protein [Eubacterium sp.]
MMTILSKTGELLRGVFSAIYGSIEDLSGLFWYNNYFYFGIFCFALTVLMIRRSKYRKAHGFLLPYCMMFLALIMYNPLAYKLLTQKILPGPEYFARLCILLPSWFLIAAVLGLLAAEQEKKWHRAALVAVTAFLLIATGTSITSNDTVTIEKASNTYKVNQKAIELADKILELSGGQDTSLLLYSHATETDDSGSKQEGKYIIGGDVADGIRQYTGKIYVSGLNFNSQEWASYIAADLFPDDDTMTVQDFFNNTYSHNYGSYIQYYAAPKEEDITAKLAGAGMQKVAETGSYRIFVLRTDQEETAKDVTAYLDTMDREETLIADYPLQEFMGAKKNCFYANYCWHAGLLSWAARIHAGYLVVPNGNLDETLAEDAGYRLLNQAGPDQIWGAVDQPLDNLWTMTQYQILDGNGNPGSFYALTDLKGHLILVDGGWTDNADQIRQIIDANGGHVDDWIFTDTHPEHVAGFNEVFSGKDKPRIDHIYVGTRHGFDSTDGAETESQRFYELTQGSRKVTWLEPGQEENLCGLKLQALGAGSTMTDKDKQEKEQKNTEEALALKLSGDSVSMLLCGDPDAEETAVLLKEKENLAATYLQAPDHGRTELTDEFLDAVQPRTVFIDAATDQSNPDDGTYLAQNLDKLNGRGLGISSLTSPSSFYLYCSKKE